MVTGSAPSPNPPVLPPDPVESPDPDEPALAAQLADAVRTMIQRQWDGDATPRTAFRDAHAKIVGLVHATVRVPDSLPADLAHGVWKPGAVYKAWIRYSNGDSPPKSDGAKDARGMAIKLCGIGADPGGRLPDDSEHATQDFVMIDNPVFFIKDARQYVAFVTEKLAHRDLRFMVPSWFLPWTWRLRSLFISLRLLKAPPSHLAQTYHSMTPYRLGPHVVKVRARPLDPATPRTGDGFDSLRDALESQLAAGPVRFALEVQRRGDRDLPIEDARVLWSEDDAPFEQVAEITIPRQVCSKPEQRAFGDRLSFSPWHGLMAHRPLGSLNRVRRMAYPASSVLRHGLNATPMVEPTGDETF
jgi:hypothetical protein